MATRAYRPHQLLANAAIAASRADMRDLRWKAQKHSDGYEVAAIETFHAVTSSQSAQRPVLLGMSFAMGAARAARQHATWLRHSIMLPFHGPDEHAGQLFDRGARISRFPIRWVRSCAGLFSILKMRDPDGTQSSELLWDAFFSSRPRLERVRRFMRLREPRATRGLWVSGEDGFRS